MLAHLFVVPVIDMQDARPQTSSRRPASHAASPRSFVLFALVGALGTACHYAILIALVHFGLAGAVVASTVGAVVGALVNFVLNHHVTFDVDVPVTETGPRYVVLVLLSFVNNAALVYLMADVLHFDYLVAQVIATGVVFLVNYLLSSLWVFAHDRAEVGR